MKRLRIAVYPGDGIGSEVTTQAVRVLRAVEAKQKEWALDLTEFPGAWNIIGKQAALSLTIFWKCSARSTRFS